MRFEKKGNFSYTCSASRQEDKLERLRKLDRAATKPGTAAAIAVGMISTLIMGQCVTKRRRDKLAPEILQLTEELIRQKRSQFCEKCPLLFSLCFAKLNLSIQYGHSTTHAVHCT